MIRVGVTGGIGSGKSTVCALFERLGVPAYDCDRRARELMDGSDSVVKTDDGEYGGADTDEYGENSLRDAIIALLGKEAYREEGGVDRAFIAGKVFDDKKLLASLNAIVHPAVAEDFEAWVQDRKEGRSQKDPTGVGAERGERTLADSREREAVPYVIMESAILFESGFDRFTDRVVVVTAPVELRIERVMARGGISREDVVKRIANQLSDSERIARADYTIDNGAGFKELAARVEELDKLLKL